MCSCKGGCSKCKPINGISQTIYIASADDGSGGGFTYPAANDDAYIGFASGNLNNYTPTLASASWIWIINPQIALPMVYVVSSNTPFTPPADTNIYHTYLQVTGLPAGTYKAWFSCEASNNVNDGSLGLIGGVRIFSNGTPSSDANSERDVYIDSVAANYIYANMATDSDKIVVGAAGVISVGAHVNNITRNGFTINFGTLTVMLIQP
jgi:hypothetical protein